MILAAFGSVFLDISGFMYGGKYCAAHDSAIQTTETASGLFSTIRPKTLQ